MLLFYCVVKQEQVLSYADLYTRLPLAESTIRGIVMEFLDERWLVRVSDPVLGGFQITRKGLIEAQAQFPRLFSESHSDRYTLLIHTSTSQVRSRKLAQLFATLGALFLRPGVAVYQGILKGSERRKLLSLGDVLLAEHVSLSTEQMLDVILSTKAGKEYYERRLRLVSMLGSIKSKGKIYHRTRQSLRIVWEKVFAEMVTQSADGSLLLEEYLQKDMRLLHLSHLL